MTASTRLRDLSPQWLGLLLTIRIAAAVTAVVLLSVHYVTSFDQTLVVAVCAYTVATVAVARGWPSIALNPLAWIADIAAVLALVALSGDWRSPFYLLALTTLAAPAAALRPARGVLLGVLYAVTYALLAGFIGPSPLTIGAQTTVETLATHLLLPVLLAFGVSYAADAVRRLRAERRRTERLAIEAERRRIAWELHDSAKQRVHAAYLVLSAVADLAEGPMRDATHQVLRELEAAATDMDTSLAELQSPLEGRPLDEALRERADALAVPGGPRITVRGTARSLDPLTTAHAFRVGSEALTNAVRHAQARTIDVELRSRNGTTTLTVIDDGRGMPDIPRARSSGLRVMHNRAATVGGELRIHPSDDGRGTVVVLAIPDLATQGEPA